VRNTSEIGLFKIISESGIGAGIRRIEAVTSIAALEHLTAYVTRVNDLATSLKVKPNNLETRVESLVNELTELKRGMESMQAKIAKAATSKLESNFKIVNGYRLLTAEFDGLNMKELREMIDKLKERPEPAVVVLASIFEEKVVIACGVSKDYIEKGINAGHIVKEVAMICGGNGGGRPDMATAGARDASKIEVGFEKVVSILKEK